LLTLLRRGQPADPVVSPVQFNPRLAAVVAELKNNAQVYQLKLPAGFGFGFERYLEGAIPSEKDVQRLVRQLQAIKSAVELLADCGVTELVSVERQVFDQTADAAAGAGRGAVRGRAAPAQNAVEAVKAGTELRADPDGLFTYERIQLRFIAKEPAVWRVLNEFSAAPRFMLVRSLTTVTDSKVLAYVPEAKNAPKVPTSGESFSIRKKRLVAGEEAVTVDLTVDVFNFTSEISG